MKAPRKALFCLAGLLVAVACAYCGRGILFSWLGGKLVVDQPAPRAGVLWIRSEDGFRPEGRSSLAQAADWYHAAPQRKILLLQPIANRLVTAGVVPSFEAIARTALTRSGVPNDAIITAAGTWHDPWEESQRLGDWLRPRPEVQVVVLAERLNTARQRWLLDHALEPELAARIAVQSLSRSEFEETNWWKRRDGVKAFMSSWLGWCYVRSQGRPPALSQPWDPQAYRRWLAQTSEGAAP